jgi:protein phosphatase
MLEAFGATDPGCVRANNEDAFVSDAALGLFVVADGMGGAAAGERASSITVATLREIVAEQAHEGGMNPAKLTTAVHEAHRRVRAAAQEDSRLEGMGTTLAAAVAAGPRLLLASVGDSRIYLFSHGALTQISQDQSWVNEVGRKLGLAAENLRAHPMRHVLTMAIGVSAQLKVNTYERTLAPGEVLLLCSDGLHSVVSDAEIAQSLAGGGSLERRARLLIDAARAHGAPDNVTVVLVSPAAS